MAQAKHKFSADTLESIIILLVQEKKCLYNRKDDDFVNTTKKMQIWKEIATEIFNLSGISIEGIIFLQSKTI